MSKLIKTDVEYSRWIRNGQRTLNMPNYRSSQGEILRIYRSLAISHRTF